MTPRRARLVLVLVVLGVVGVGVQVWEPIWWVVMTDKTYDEMTQEGGQPIRGIHYRLKSTGQRVRAVWWYADTGLKSSEYNDPPKDDNDHSTRKTDTGGRGGCARGGECAAGGAALVLGDDERGAV